MVSSRECVNRGGRWEEGDRDGTGGVRGTEKGVSQIGNYIACAGSTLLLHLSSSCSFLFIR